MPTYEYRCANNHQFDLVQPVGAAAPPCPQCGSPTRKIYTSVGLIFKGSGFHVTDYRRPAAPDGDGAKSSAAGVKAEGDKKSETPTSGSTGTGGGGGGDATGGSGSEKSGSA